MTDRNSPKAELILTLDAMWALLAQPGLSAELRLAQLKGLLDHARAVAQRVGSVAKVRKPKDIAP